MSITFRYKRVDRPPPLEPDWSPSIPITLRAMGEPLNVIALLDSGANISIIPKGIAEILNLDLTGEKEDIIGISGKTSGVKSTLNITVKNAHERYTFLIHVLILMDDTGENFPIILGRKDFFEKFEITFKEKDKKVVLKRVH